MAEPVEPKDYGVVNGTLAVAGRTAKSTVKDTARFGARAGAIGGGIAAVPALVIGGGVTALVVAGVGIAALVTLSPVLALGALGVGALGSAATLGAAALYGAPAGVAAGVIAGIVASPWAAVKGLYSSVKGVVQSKRTYRAHAQTTQEFLQGQATGYAPAVTANGQAVQDFPLGSDAAPAAETGQSVTPQDIEPAVERTRIKDRAREIIAAREAAVTTGGDSHLARAVQSKQPAANAATIGG